MSRFSKLVDSSPRSPRRIISEIVERRSSSHEEPTSRGFSPSGETDDVPCVSIAILPDLSHSISAAILCSIRCGLYSGARHSSSASLLFHPLWLSRDPSMTSSVLRHHHLRDYECAVYQRWPTLAGQQQRGIRLFETR